LADVRFVAQDLMDATAKRRVPGGANIRRPANA